MSDPAFSNSAFAAYAAAEVEEWALNLPVA
jgi:hypothetical protein